ncbi:septum site-determining protein MinC [Stappia sp. F7233]|uniref:Probable septum site-determining protein MinC n=1 Tax=Stappia albiluteola TaxID=2758565 RepID=A0A839AEG4_9HYPH|nr:septum site-determining protein MinC [Stappia albiluteola]MBA5778200.1 septum site-determining protein MinC [Stappia albiluteola]
MRFRGKSFIAIVLSPEHPRNEWFKEIDRIISRSPGFFLNRPIVLDVRGQKLSSDELEDLHKEIISRGIQVMGIEGVADMKLKPGMPPSISGGRSTSDIDAPGEPDVSVKAEKAVPEKQVPTKAEEPSGEAASKAAADTLTETEDKAQSSGGSLLICEPVRSGQSILFPEGDVTVVGAVSSGAEIIAGGSIHVYGALRGRALAGISGNSNARIFCSRLDAELVAINGMYKVADDFEPRHIRKPVQVQLKDDRLIFETLD